MWKIRCECDVEPAPDAARRFSVAGMRMVIAHIEKIAANG